MTSILSVSIYLSIYYYIVLLSERCRKVILSLRQTVIKVIYHQIFTICYHYYCLDYFQLLSLTRKLGKFY